MQFSPNNRYLVGSSFEKSHYVRIVDVSTGRDWRFLELPASSWSVAFSPDGSKLVSGFADSSSLIWNIADPPVVGESKPIDSQTFQDLWKVLAEPGVVESYRAIFRLANAGDGTVSFLSKQMQPVKAADPDEIKKLLRDLGDDTFTTRKTAFRRLKELDRLAIKEVEAAFKTSQSQEVKKRCNDLLKSARSNLVTNREQIHQLRAIQVLEKIGSPKAEALLEKLATGAPEARQTIEAKKVLARLQIMPAKSLK